jgi:hypothetical protein
MPRNPRGRSRIVSFVFHSSSGSGLAARRVVSVTSDDIVDYLTHITDTDGRLSAPLPATAVTGTGHIW